MFVVTIIIFIVVIIIIFIIVIIIVVIIIVVVFLFSLHSSPCTHPLICLSPFPLKVFKKQRKGYSKAHPEDKRSGDRRYENTYHISYHSTNIFNCPYLDLHISQQLVNLFFLILFSTPKPVSFIPTPRLLDIILRVTKNVEDAFMGMALSLK